MISFQELTGSSWFRHSDTALCACAWSPAQLSHGSGQNMPFSFSCCLFKTQGCLFSSPLCYLKFKSCENGRMCDFVSTWQLSLLKICNHIFNVCYFVNLSGDKHSLLVMPLMYYSFRLEEHCKISYSVFFLRKKSESM